MAVKNRTINNHSVRIKPINIMPKIAIPARNTDVPHFNIIRVTAAQKHPIAAVKISLESLLNILNTIPASLKTHRVQKISHGRFSRNYHG